MLLPSADMTVVLGWVINHGYWLMFLAMLIEGPIITAAAAFSFALGYFTLPAIFVLSLLGDLVADIIYYAIGYWGRISLVERYGHYFGLTNERMERIEHHLEAHGGKTLLALKLAPFIPTPGLMLVGVARMRLPKFTLISLAITIPKTILFMIVGYYFGQAYSTFSKDFGYASMGIAVIILLYMFYKAYQKSAEKIGESIEKI